MLMMDKYDVAMADLFEHPEQIRAAWVDPVDHPAGCLFQMAGHPDGGRIDLGCLTMVRANLCFPDAATPALTAAIRADTRIPAYAEAITTDDLPVFAEWQRRLDRELGR